MNEKKIDELDEIKNEILTLKDIQRGFTKLIKGKSYLSVVKGKGSKFILKNKDQDKDIEFEHVEGWSLKKEAMIALNKYSIDKLKQKGYLQNE